MSIFRLFFLALAFLASLIAQSQVPQGISYQAALRLPNGQVMTLTQVSVRFSVLADSPTGPVLWQETHNTVTSIFGMFTLIAGAGQSTGAGSLQSFSVIPWSQGDMYLKVEAAQGQGNYDLIGTSRLLTVPYAFHAETVENNNDADANPANELIDQLEYADGELLITEAGITHSVDISALATDADADPANELIASVYMETGNLIIQEGGVDFTVDLSVLGYDPDMNPNNELIQSIVLDSTLSISLTEGGLTHNVDLTALLNDADSNPYNEALVAVQLLGSTLMLTEGAQELSVDLSALAQDVLWVENGTAIHNDSESVGIGTASPTGTLHVNGSYSAAFRKLAGAGPEEVLATDQVLLCDVTANSAVLTLPSATSCEGRIYTFRKLALMPPPITNVLLINAAAGDLIENQPSMALSSFFPESAVLISDGNGWWILSKSQW